MIGRFIYHSGKSFNMPTARSGIISAFPNPNEPIPVSKMKPQEAFLIEMRSLSGFSGSPTFGNLRFLEFLENLKIALRNYYRIECPDDIAPDYTDFFYLLGIDSGNFPMYEKVIEKIDGREETTNFKAINHSGFSIVIPAWKIKETLDRDEFVMDRKKRDKESEHKEGSVRLDFSEADEPVFTKEDFEIALKKVSRKISEPEKEKT